MNTETAAKPAVEFVNGLPGPVAVGFTILLCVGAVAWVIYTLVKDSRTMAVRRKCD